MDEDGKKVKKQTKQIDKNKQNARVEGTSCRVRDAFI